MEGIVKKLCGGKTNYTVNDVDTLCQSVKQATPIKNGHCKIPLKDKSGVSHKQNISNNSPMNCNDKTLAFSTRDCYNKDFKKGNRMLETNMFIDETYKNSGNTSSIDNTVNNEMRCFRDLNNKLTSILDKLDVSNINETYEQSGFVDFSEYNNFNVVKRDFRKIINKNQ